MLRFPLLALLLLAAPAAAVACPAAPPPEAARRPLDAARPDQALLSAAVLSQVNALRCAAGRTPLAGRGGLARVAATHSAYLARAQSLAHASDVPGQETLERRLRAAGEAFRTGAENVGYLGGCNRSYLQLAHEMVRIWAESRPHRANMLNGALTRAGAGIAMAGGCVRAYVTLDLAG
jgi:uncharacterized protein YkwD